MRTIGYDPTCGGVGHLASLQHPQTLGIWNDSYDRVTGRWSDALLAAAVHQAMGGDAPLQVEEDDENNANNNEYEPMDDDLS